MEIPTRNKLLQHDQDIIAFQESAHHQNAPFSYYQCFQQPQDFNTLVSGPAISHPERIMQVGFSSASSKRRKAAAADIMQVHHGGGGGRVIRSISGRKDRHSKVSTARGTRDRRVRLSPKTAIQFYDVQDRLGYDRPSKAIDWLMKEAQSAIDALHLHAPPPPLPIIDNFIDTNCFAANHHAGFDCFSSTNIGVAVPFFSSSSSSSSSSEFQVFPIVDETPDEYSIVDPRFHEAFFTWNYAREDDSNSYFVRSLPLEFSDKEMLFQREPLQSIYPNITASNCSPPFPGIAFSNDQELLPTYPLSMDSVIECPTATNNSLLHFQE